MAKDNIKGELEAPIGKLIKSQERELRAKERLIASIEDSNDYTRQAAEKRKEELLELNTLGNVADQINDVLGQQEGIMNAITSELTDMLQDESMAKAVTSGDGLMQQKMVEQLVATMRDSGLSDDANVRMILDDLQANFDKMDWKEMADKAQSTFYATSESFKEAANDMRHTIVDKFPMAGRFLSDAMIEHYKKGFEKAFGAFQDKAKEILSPLNDILGPVIGLIQGLWILGKTLLTESTDYERSTAEWTKRTAEVLESMHEEQKDARTDEKLGPQKKEGGLLSRMIPSLPGGGLARLGIGGMVIAMIGFMVKNYIDGFMKGGTLEESLVKGAAQMWEPILAIPEWVINKISEHIFGSDFRVDFSAEKIEQAINDFNDWLFENVTKPVLDFFIVDLPKFFTETIPEAIEKMPEKLEKLVDDFSKSISDTFGSIFKWFSDTFSWENISRLIYDSAKAVGAPDWMIPDKIIPDVETNADVVSKAEVEGGMARAAAQESAAVKELVKENNRLVQETTKNNEKLTESVSSALVAVGEGQSKRDIPVVTDDYGVMASQVLE